MHLAHYLGLLHRAQVNLAGAFREVAEAHGAEPDVAHLCRQQARICDRHAERLEPFARRYAEEAPDEPDLEWSGSSLLTVFGQMTIERIASDGRSVGL